MQISRALFTNWDVISSRGGVGTMYGLTSTRFREQYARWRWLFAVSDCTVIAICVEPRHVVVSAARERGGRKEHRKVTSVWW